MSSTEGGGGGRGGEKSCEGNKGKLLDHLGLKLLLSPPQVTVCTVCNLYSARCCQIGYCVGYIYCRQLERVYS